MKQDDKTPQDTSAAPAPEVLKVASSSEAPETSSADAPVSSGVTAKSISKPRRLYRPSHKGTFIGLIVVAVILAVNAFIIYLVMKSKPAQADATQQGVTINSEVLSKLGVSRNAVGNAGTELIVGPNAKFGGDVTIAKNMDIAGQLTLNGTFKAPEAAFNKLQAGDTSVEKLNVNGDGTISTLNLRKDLQVAGITRLQGQLTVNQLTTINNNMNIAGNLSVGGALSVRSFQVGQLTVAGHLISTGSTPSVSAGGAVGNNGTVSLSGNDSSGTVAVNTGTGAGGGLLANISFNEKYATTPHVVVTAVGRGVDGLFVNRTSGGFSISVTGSMPPGGYAFDYIVMQ